MTTRFCKACFAPIKINSLHALLDPSLCLCDRCLKTLAPKIITAKVDGVKGMYLFPYNEAIKEKIYTLKGCGDIELANIFLTYYRHDLKNRFRGYIIVRAPSSIEADQTREFNHVEEIFKSLGLPILNLIKKRIAFKQSDLNRAEREQVGEKLMVEDIEKIYHKKVLFVDDISTSGSTLKACLALIKKGQPRRIRFLVVAKVEAK
ncbi:MAG: hypothetical protein MJ206_03315 [Bacilli bacterium]|nr:hypothetical protein [Bacilli bacterium]